MEQIKLSLQHINAFHLDQSLLFQFILSDLLTAYQESQLISVMASKILQGDFEGLEVPLFKLSGSYEESLRLFAWNPDNSVLSKLKHYCLCFTNLVEVIETHQISLHQQAQQTWLLGLHCLKSLHYLKENGFEIDCATSLQRSLLKLTKSIRRLGQNVIKTIHDFHENENVIFFILRHFKQFDETFGKDFVKKLFTKMYENGIQEASRLMSQKYSKRGFHHLLPIILTKISEL